MFTWVDETKRKPRSPEVTQEEWSPHEGTLEKLYMKENKTLAEVMRIMATEEHFTPSKSQYLSQLEKWGFRKHRRHAQPQQDSFVDMKDNTETTPTVVEILQENSATELRVGEGLQLYGSSSRAIPRNQEQMKVMLKHRFSRNKNPLTNSQLDHIDQIARFFLGAGLINEAATLYRSIYNDAFQYHEQQGSSRFVRAAIDMAQCLPYLSRKSFRNFVQSINLKERGFLSVPPTTTDRCLLYSEIGALSFRCGDPDSAILYCSHALQWVKKLPETSPADRFTITRCLFQACKGFDDSEGWNPLKIASKSREGDLDIGDICYDEIRSLLKWCADELDTNNSIKFMECNFSPPSLRALQKACECVMSSNPYLKLLVLFLYQQWKKMETASSDEDLVYRRALVRVESKVGIKAESMFSMLSSMIINLDEHVFICNEWDTLPFLWRQNSARILLADSTFIKKSFSEAEALHMKLPTSELWRDSCPVYRAIRSFMERRPDLFKLSSNDLQYIWNITEDQSGLTNSTWPCHGARPGEDNEDMSVASSVCLNSTNSSVPSILCPPRYLSSETAHDLEPPSAVLSDSRAAKYLLLETDHGREPLSAGLSDPGVTEYLPLGIDNEL